MVSDGHAGSIAIDARLLETLLQALLKALQDLRRSDVDEIDWDNVKVGGTD